MRDRTRRRIRGRCRSCGLFRLEGGPGGLFGRNRRRPRGGRGSRSARRRSGGFGDCRRRGVVSDLRRGHSRAHGPSSIETMTITASGGPFREWSAERISAATREEALAHPNWVMGPKVTIDSAGLMNKGLELIEAHHLFGLAADRLDVVVHPQSIVHGLIAFADGSLIAGMASPDMRTPIAHCLAYPDRIASGVRPPDLAALGRLTFERADLRRFPALGLAIDALRSGGGAATALNAANEVAVAAFLDQRIGFGDIARLVAKTLAAMTATGELSAPADIAEALAIHHIATDRTASLLA